MKNEPIIMEQRRVQRGASLLASVSILALMTLLSVVASGGLLLQHKALAAGMDREQLLREAERGLAWGEKLLQGPLPEACLSGCDSNALVWDDSALPPASELEASTWWPAHAIDYGSDPAGILETEPWPGESAPPRILIADLHRQHYSAAAGANYELHYYRVYARAYGDQGEQQLLLAATIAIPYFYGVGDDNNLEPVAIPCTLIDREQLKQDNPDLPAFQCDQVGWRPLG